MTKTVKIVLAVVGALVVICGVLLLLKKKFGGNCKICGKKSCKCGDTDTVEDFVEEAAAALEEKAEDAKDTLAETKEKAQDFVEEKLDAAKEKAEAIVEEFKDYADVDLSNN